MPNKIERQVSAGATYTLTATAPTSSTTKIPFAASAGGVIVVTAVTGTPATLSWYTCVGAEGTPIPVQDGVGSAVTTTLSSSNSYVNAYPIPDALFGSQFIVATTNSGTATIQLVVKT